MQLPAKPLPLPTCAFTEPRSMEMQTITFVLVKLHLGILSPEFELAVIFVIFVLSWISVMPPWKCLHAGGGGGGGGLVNRCVSAASSRLEIQKGDRSFPRNGAVHCLFSVPSVLRSQLTVQHRSHLLLIMSNKQERNLRTC